MTPRVNCLGPSVPVYAVPSPGQMRVTRQQILIRESEMIGRVAVKKTLSRVSSDNARKEILRLFD